MPPLDCRASAAQRVQITAAAGLDRLAGQEHPEFPDEADHLHVGW
jgi:hypothetical protein